MSRPLALALLGAVCVAEVLYRVSELWESIGRAACPCGGDL